MDDKKAGAGLSAEKQKALAAALTQIEKQFGKGSTMRAWAMARLRRISRWYPPDRSAWTSRSAWAACRAAGWSKSTARNRQARPR
ncbi:hypothetical protein ACTMU2_23195 [Cupriavidus basilensis]